MQLNPDVTAKIRARESEALAAGWTKELLWEARFWNIVNLQNRPGLAAVLHPDYDIGEITESYIEAYRLDKGRKIVQRFYHPDRMHSSAGA